MSSSSNNQDKLVREKLVKAFRVTREFGLPDAEVKTVLKDMLRVFDNKWLLIESENYRALVDRCFERREEQEAKDKAMGAANQNSNSSSAMEELSKKIRSAGSEQLGDLSPVPSMRKRKMESGFKDVASNSITWATAGPASPAVTFREGMSVDKKSNEAGSSYEDEKLVPHSNIPHMQSIKNFASGSMMASNDTKKNLNLGNSSLADRKLVNGDEKTLFRSISDITTGHEKIKISLIDETGIEKSAPEFVYMPQNIVYQNAYVNVSLARISDADCCVSCKADCLSVPCACARKTGGEFAYTKEGVLRDEFLTACISMKNEPDDHPLVYCQDCPLERFKNEKSPEDCKGHLLRKFIKECWARCGCNQMLCGNRIVQRGITCKLQVFFVSEAKGWGLRALQDLPKGAFVCEYVGEILTNMELHNRNMQSSGSKRHTYPVTLDADWGSERILKDEEALFLDATFYGNVARFINHRCYDSTLIDIPIEVETPDRHYYHLALFTSRDVKAMEELTWDYGIDFSDHEHPIKAFRCQCGSKFCRDVKQKDKTLRSVKKKVGQHASGSGKLVSAPAQRGVITRNRVVAAPAQGGVITRNRVVAAPAQGGVITRNRVVAAPAQGGVITRGRLARVRKTAQK